MILRVICFICLLGNTVMASAQQQANMIERKPDNAPRSETHRNKMDEIGQRQGTWMYFNIYKEKYAEINYVNDKMEGMVKKFYPGGKVREECEYLGGKREGEYKRYYFSGELYQEGVYAKGQKVGHWVRYYNDGSIKSEGDVVNGKLEGDWKYYDRKGAVSKIVKYVNGVEYSPAAAADLAQKKSSLAPAKTTAAKPAPKK